MPVSIDRMPNKPHIQRGANGTAATVRPVQGVGPQGPAGPGNSNADVAGYVTGAGPTQTALQASTAEAIAEDDYVPDMTPREATAGVAADVFGILSPSGDTTGVTDTARIQAREDLGLDTNLLTGTTYYVKGLVKRDGTTIYGRGATIQLPDGANDDVIVGHDFDTLHGTDTATATGAGVTAAKIVGPITIDGNKANQTALGTTIAAGSDGAALPQGTLNVASTTGFPSSGKATVYVDSRADRPLGGSGIQIFSYTGKTSTSFTGVTWLTGGTGTLRLGDPVHGKGYGVRVYGRNFSVTGPMVEIRNCVADNLWTEWGNGGATATADTGSMEAAFSNMKLYNGGRTGWTFYGPHDSSARGIVAYKNGISGVCVMRGLLALDDFHGWGSPQRYALDLYGATKVAGDSFAEVPNVFGAVGIRIHGVPVIFKGKVLTPPSSPNSGAVGITMTGSPSRCQIHAQVLDCNGGALIAYTDGGQNDIRIHAVQDRGAAILRSATTVTSGSNGVDVATFTGSGTLNVTDTTTLTSTGAAMVQTANGFQLVTYTGKTGTTLTGCTSAGSGVMTTGAMVTGVNQLNGGAANSTGTNIDPTSVYRIDVSGGTTAQPWHSDRTPTTATAALALSATADTYTTAGSVTKGVSAIGLDVGGIAFVTASVSSETITCQVTATYDDGTTQSTTATTTASTTLSFSAANVYSLRKAGRHIVKLDFNAKSSKASTTATVTWRFAG